MVASPINMARRQTERTYGDFVTSEHTVFMGSSYGFGRIKLEGGGILHFRFPLVNFYFSITEGLNLWRPAIRRYGPGSGSDLAPLECTPYEAPGRYRSLYRTGAHPQQQTENGK